MQTITLYLPGSTDVVVKGFTNAAYLQRVTLTMPVLTKTWTYTGSGEGNNPIFTLPLTTPTGNDIELDVNFDYSFDGGNTWNAATIYADSCTIQDYQVNIIVSEDLADADYNDCVCFVSFPEVNQSVSSGSDDSQTAKSVSSLIDISTTETPLGDSITVLLPYSTTVVIQGFVNAANMQQVSIQPLGGNTTIWTGSGYYDTLLGAMTLATPSGSGQGFPVTVTIQNSSDGGNNWQASQVDQGSCQPMFYATRIVASEDGVDNSWDDATVYFTWTALPE